MAKKCIGVREYTGHPCQRPASRGSDFCFACKQQEGNEKIINLQHDVYHCPDDGQKLWYVPKRKMHRCDMCGGVLLNGKEIDPVLLENILGLPEALDEGSVVECPTCIPDSGRAEGEVSFSNFTVEWQFFGQKELGYFDVTYHGVSNVGHCTVCASTWFAGPGEFDALGRALGKNTTRVWREQFRRLGKKEKLWHISGGERRAIKTKNTFGVQEQSLLRQARLAGVETETERKWKEAASRSDNLCKHVADNGKMCNHRKSAKSTHDQDYCYKHQPE